jgi:hypothetical protein
LDEHGYNPAQPMRVLDMACGSGSFLIEAFDALDRHLANVRGETLGGNDDARDHARRSEILTECLYGVDKDEQAVAVAKLNLSLKALHTRYTLPMLTNIRVGDSLISGSPEELKAALGKRWKDEKPFDWAEEFPHVMQVGGFDVIVGNPPYVQMSMDARLRETYGQYLIEQFGSSMGRLNTFGFFIHRGIDLLRPGGRLGFIVPNTVLTMPYYRELREYILQRCAIEAIGTFAEGPFADAVVENVILVLRREDDAEKRRCNQVEVSQIAVENSAQAAIPQREYEQAHDLVFNVRTDSQAKSLQAKLQANADCLGDLVHINQAIALKGDRSASLFNRSKGKNYKPVLDGRDIGRYALHWPGAFLRYDVERIHSCKRQDIFLAAEKLLFRRVGDSLVATWDDQQFYALNTLVVITPKLEVNLKFILALINSRLLNHYFVTFLKSTKKVFSEIQARQMAQLPIRRINFADPVEKQAHDELAACVDKMLALQKEYAEADRGLRDSRHDLKRRIDELDADIDRRVYTLYGLTDQEIQTVENSL